ncbi:MAG TPA: hypothetical protein DD644_15090 [Halomonas sp.]|uniref:Uncharacterized protein n=2 Tax=Halomonadaceae TaxID=28256 RepID=A0A3D0KBS8_9GAMM|nr:hypothetical protein CUU95_07795 [Halomonas alkaliphila]PAU72099.1 hypothetical protein CK497_10010 [Halomonas humidisoli]HBP43035.1 hypothetical protein [Halomonas sp.]HBS83243.1 hypothetical protein [Halomonas campaniensis]HCA00631.1 hypothetical protein [Halomonas campaniensis]
MFSCRNTAVIFGILASFSCVQSYYSQPVYADSLDDFAAQLLCRDEADCPSSQSAVPRTPLVIEGTVLPDDAARGVDEEQAFFIQQGAYLNQTGALVSLEGSAIVVTLPERGQLKTGSGTAVVTAPLSAPVIITIPSEKRE